MAAKSPTVLADVQDIALGTARLQLKALNSGVEYWKTWMAQAAKLGSIADGALAGRHNSVSDTVRRISDLGRENVDVLGKAAVDAVSAYLDEAGKLADSAVAAVRSKRSGAKSRVTGAATRPRMRRSRNRKH